MTVKLSQKEILAKNSSRFFGGIFDQAENILGMKMKKKVHHFT